MKPCCGIVEFTPIDLAPGAKSAVHVILKKTKPGPIEHLTIFETDDPAVKSMELRTTAEVYPDYDVVDSDESSGRIELAEGESKSLTFVLRSFGTQSDPPRPIDSLSFRSSLHANWLGEISNSELDNGVRVVSRKYQLTLKNSDGEPGPKIDEYSIISGEKLILSRRIAWEVSASVVAKPGVLWASRSSETIQRRVILISTDGSPFRLIDIRSDRFACRMRSKNEKAALKHEIEIEMTPIEMNEKSNETTSIEFTIDHPKRKSIRIPIMLTRGTSPRKEEAS